MKDMLISVFLILLTLGLAVISFTGLAFCDAPGSTEFSCFASSGSVFIVGLIIVWGPYFVHQHFQSKKQGTNAKGFFNIKNIGLIFLLVGISIAAFVFFS